MLPILFMVRFSPSMQQKQVYNCKTNDVGVVKCLVVYRHLLQMHSNAAVLQLK